ncbi:MULTISPECIES: hypothetical protein [Gammaproteobacteria]|uniref:Uncharacterized protein n=1 Tax=Vreelandella venusta TaxID=44935 RepID=A0AAP9ZG33_9GAMM|nr:MULTISPECIES: hypothetical protein [Gammaproteobacteria]MBR9924116.1 hypothetical protein [Gammaproteobacteria bacterium]AZM95031.1 hypothetical protein EI420_04695 [Halomonas venusta]MDX1751516.1 hypothetical protein [Methylophaga sp.]NPT29532.1 hypothetical protein [Halomonas venusta]QPI65063.1 hypothetical protein IR195_04910 [Halomonas venusta]
MTLILHRLAASVAVLCIATFFSATIFVELFGTEESIATLKSLIVWPGLFILIPSIALTGGSGFALAKSRRGKLVLQKKKRMPFIGANGILVLIPCAVLLDRWASVGAFDTNFYVVQGVELLAGAINLILMGMNMRDGLRMSGRFRRFS